MKYEEVYLKAYEGVDDAKAGPDAYLDFYNEEGPHQSLQYRTPGKVSEAGPLPLNNADIRFGEHSERRGADPQLILV